MTFEKIELDNKIVVYRNFFDNPNIFVEMANDIFQKFPKLNYKPATINNHEYNTSLRSCTVFSLNTQQVDHDLIFGDGSKKEKKDLNKLIDRKTFLCINDYLKTYNFSVKYREAWEMLSYSESQKLTWHSDDGASHPCSVSFVYYFNDNYEGGEVEFKNYGQGKYKPKSGDLLIFPSAPDYLHQVLPVLSGVKYCAISFAR